MSKLCHNIIFLAQRHTKNEKKNAEDLIDYNEINSCYWQEM